MRKTVSIKETVGGGYGRFWHFKGRYRVIKGSRASKKSKTVALWYIINMMKYQGANLLVVRMVKDTLKDSCRAELVWAINRLNVAHLWDIPKGSLTLTYKPTGQQILFRGLDDPFKITSIAVITGELCWMWLEEAYQVINMSDFDVLDESIRGETSVFKQITITFNPWHQGSWLRTRFFETDNLDGTKTPVEEPDILALTTTYHCNEWLDEADHRLFERMRTQNPKRYQVAGLGNWGVSEGLIFENWRTEILDLVALYEERPYLRQYTRCGLDYGYSADPCYFNEFIIDLQKQQIFIPWNEISDTGLSNKELAQRIIAKGKGKEIITADAAEPKSNDELRHTYGLRIQAARKGKDSINNGIQFIQGFEIVIDPRNKVLCGELGLYQWAKDRQGKQLDRPEDANNHGIDAMRYALEEFTLPRKKITTFDKALIFGARR